jgi:pyruvate/2-oxoglutarate dehydrogenase complex dihydrolipoamide acyltransferase (E2) component
VHSSTLAFAAALCLAGFLPEHARASPEHDALVYLDAQVLPKKAVACSARIAGYTARFDPAFRTWLSRNKERVAAGEAFLRAEAERTRVPFEPDIQAVGVSMAQQWTALPMVTLQDNCEALLLQLNEPES